MSTFDIKLLKAWDSIVITSISVFLFQAPKLVVAKVKNQLRYGQYWTKRRQLKTMDFILMLYLKTIIFLVDSFLITSKRKKRVFFENVRLWLIRAGAKVQVCIILAPCTSPKCLWIKDWCFDNFWLNLHYEWFADKRWTLGRLKWCRKRSKSYPLMENAYAKYWILISYVLFSNFSTKIHKIFTNVWIIIVQHLFKDRKNQ